MTKCYGHVTQLLIARRHDRCDLSSITTTTPPSHMASSANHDEQVVASISCRIAHAFLALIDAQDPDLVYWQTNFEIEVVSCPSIYDWALFMFLLGEVSVCQWPSSPSRVPSERARVRETTSKATRPSKRGKDVFRQPGVGSEQRDLRRGCRRWCLVDTRGCGRG